MHPTFSLGRIAGMRVGANWSLGVVVWLIAWSLADSQLPSAAPGYSEGAYWATGTAAALIFFGCLLAHELAHSFVARRAGVEVVGIVLWLFGGVSQFGGESPTAEDELEMAAAGPAASFGLAATFLGANRVVAALDGPELIAAGVAWLGWINLTLAIFNLIPAFPLDGGRVLRAWLWHHRGDKTSATLSAAAAGRTFGYVLIGLGLLQFAAGLTLGGLWLVFLGWFLLSAAAAESTQSVLHTQLHGIPVSVAMTANPIVAPADISLDDLLDQWLYRQRCSTFPLADPGGTVVGLATLGRIKRVPPEQRHRLKALDVAAPVDEVVVCDANDPLEAVISRLNASPDQRALVYSGGRLVGIVSPSDIARVFDRLHLSRPTDQLPRRRTHEPVRG